MPKWVSRDQTLYMSEGDCNNTLLAYLDCNFAMLNVDWVCVCAYLSARTAREWIWVSYRISHSSTSSRFQRGEMCVCVLLQSTLNASKAKLSRAIALALHCLYLSVYRLTTNEGHHTCTQHILILRHLRILNYIYFQMSYMLLWPLDRHALIRFVEIEHHPERECIGTIEGVYKANAFSQGFQITKSHKYSTHYK